MGRIHTYMYIDVDLHMKYMYICRLYICITYVKHVYYLYNIPKKTHVIHMYHTYNTHVAHFLVYNIIQIMISLPNLCY